MICKFVLNPREPGPIYHAHIPFDEIWFVEQPLHKPGSCRVQYDDAAIILDMLLKAREESYKMLSISSG